jgi:hypothetical protein
MNKERTTTPPSRYITFTPTPPIPLPNSQENPGRARTLPSHSKILPEHPKTENPRKSRKIPVKVQGRTSEDGKFQTYLGKCSVRTRREKLGISWIHPSLTGLLSIRGGGEDSFCHHTPWL